jgi:MFS family permease
MSKKQLLLFGLVLMLIFGNGGGLATMVPVHLSRLGVEPARIGFLFSCLYFGIASSGILSGWLADRLQRYKLMCVLSAAGEIVTSLLMLWANSFLTLAVALFLAWFLAGMHAALVSAMVGQQARENERGRVFGVIGFITGLGTVLSGFLYGRIVDGYGFETLLVLNLGISVLWTILSLFYQEPAELPRMKKADNRPGKPVLKSSFFLVVIAAILGWVAINGGKLGITLVMTGLNFTAGDVSLTTGIASLAALAVPLFLGWLSDQIGRKPLLLTLNLLGLGGLLLISQNPELTGFCAASALLSLYGCFGGLSNALAADLAPRQSLGFALALINSSAHVAGIFSSMLLGLGIHALGSKIPFLIAMLLPLAAAILISVVAEKKPAISGLIGPQPAEISSSGG